MALSDSSKCADWNKATPAERVAFVEQTGYTADNITVRGDWAMIRRSSSRLTVSAYLSQQVTGFCAANVSSDTDSVTGALEGTALALGITRKSE